MCLYFGIVSSVIIVVSFKCSSTVTISEGAFLMNCVTKSFTSLQYTSRTNCVIVSDLKLLNIITRSLRKTKVVIYLFEFMERPLKRSNVLLRSSDVGFYFPVELWGCILKHIIISKRNFLSLALTCKIIYELVLEFCNLSKVGLKVTESICKEGNHVYL